MSKWICVLGRKFIKNVPFKISSRFLFKLPDFLLTLPAPALVAIEPTAFCNLKCPLCFRNSMTRKQGNMSLDEFRIIINKLPKSVRVIELFGQGDPLMNKNIFKMIEYAEYKKFNVRTSTNAMLLNNFVDEVFKSNLTELIVTLDGASKESHEKYRIGSNFEKTVDNIKLVCDKKKTLGVKKPDIVLQVLIMKHNEHELEKIKQLAKSIGVDHLIFKTVSLGAFKNTAEKFKLGQSYLPKNKRYIRDSYINKRSLCYWVWGIMILWNGDVTMCCYDYDCKYKLGNLLQQNFSELYKSQKYVSLRRAMLTQTLSICRECNYSGEISIKIF